MRTHLPTTKPILGLPGINRPSLPVCFSPRCLGSTNSACARKEFILIRRAERRQQPMVFFYINSRFKSGYTNGGNLIGSWIGREGQGAQAWPHTLLLPR